MGDDKSVDAHLELDDELNPALDRVRRARALQEAAGSITDSGHDWDPDPAAWARDQRRGDSRPVG